MRMIDPILAEFEQECATTRRLLEHVPEDKLAWKPSEKSMSLGDLAGHVATLPGNVAEILGADSFDITARTEIPEGPTTKAELLEMFDTHAQAASAWLGGIEDDRAMAEWALEKEGERVMALPRIAGIRGFLLNHLYHHRGQISTYLRIAGAHVPSVYGPTADENPFE